MTKRAILQLDGLTCPSCMTKIQSALQNQAGVEKVQVLFNASKLRPILTTVKFLQNS